MGLTGKILLGTACLITVGSTAKRAPHGTNRFTKVDMHAVRLPSRVSRGQIGPLKLRTPGSTANRSELRWRGCR